MKVLLNYPYQIKIRPLRSDKHLAIIEWLQTNMGQDIDWDRGEHDPNCRWVYCYFGTWAFKSHEDAVLFAMRWG